MKEPISRPLRVFLCHASEDKPAVRNLYQKLNAEGWMEVWLDENELLPGQDWNLEIEKALNESDAVIVTLSTRSVSKEGYVQRELKYVLDRALEKPEGAIFIMPVRLDDCERPHKLRSLQDIDYFPFQRRQEAYSRLLQSLNSLANDLGIPTKKVPTTTSLDSGSTSQAFGRQLKRESALKGRLFKGTVQDFHEWEETERRLNFFNSSYYEVRFIVRSFTLVGEFDEDGEELPPIPVLMRGEYYSGPLKEGDKIQLYEETWSPGKQIRTNRVLDLNRNVDIVAQNSRKAEVIRQAIIFIVGLIVFLIIAFYVLGN